MEPNQRPRLADSAPERLRRALRRLRGRAAGLLLVGCLSLLGGCSPIQWYAQQSGKGAVRGFYDGIITVDPRIRHRVNQELFGDPVLQQAAHDLTASIVGGAIDGLAKAKLDKMAGQMVHDTLSTLREQGDSAMKQFIADAGPQLERVLHRGIEDAVLTLGAAVHKSAEADMGAATTLLMRAAADGMMQSLSRAGRELFKDMDDKTERFLADKVAPGAGQVARTFTREAVLGLQDGLAQGGFGNINVNAKDQLPALRMVMREIGVGLGEGLGVGFGRSVQQTPWVPVLTGVSLLLGAMLLGTGAVLFLIWRRYASTSKSLGLFAQELSEVEKTDQPRAQELRRAIHEAHQVANHSRFLDNFLKHRGLYKGATPASGARLGADMRGADPFMDGAPFEPTPNRETGEKKNR